MAVMNAHTRIAVVLIFLMLAWGLAAQWAAPSTARAAPQRVAISGESVGTIIIRTGQRRLYLVTGPGQAISYPVGVGRAGKQWTGESFISSKRLRPAWA